MGPTFFKCFLFRKAEFLSCFFFSGVKIEKSGDWFYLRYAELGVRWGHESSWFLTVDESVTHRGGSTVEGLCGNHNDNPYGTSSYYYYYYYYYAVFNAPYVCQSMTKSQARETREQRIRRGVIERLQFLQRIPNVWSAIGETTLCEDGSHATASDYPRLIYVTAEAERFSIVSSCFLLQPASPAAQAVIDADYN